MKIKATEQQVQQMFANAYQAVAGQSIDPHEFNLSKSFDGRRRLSISSWCGVLLGLGVTAISADIFEVVPAEPREDDHPWAKTYPSIADLAQSAGAQVLQ